jgi:hypothetical protein
MSAVVKLVKKAAKVVVNTVKAIIKDPLPTILSIAGQAVGIPAPVTMAALTAARGGDLGDIAKSAVIAYVAPQATSKIASAIAPTVSSAITNEAAAKAVTTATSKALVNGSLAAATGGDFADAAAGTMAGSLVASGYQKLVAPEVLEKAQNLGLSKDTASTVSNVLKTGVASGAATAAKGGDFANGFAAGVSEKIEDIATDTVGDALNSAAKSIKVAINPPTDAGVPAVAIADVPVSPNAVSGKIVNNSDDEIGAINPVTNTPAQDQVIAAFSQPKSEGVGTQIGLPTASLDSSATLPGYKTTEYDTPQVSPSGRVSSGIMEPITVTSDPNAPVSYATTQQDIVDQITSASPTTPVRSASVDSPASIDQEFSDKEYLRSLISSATQKPETITPKPAVTTAPALAPTPTPAPAPEPTTAPVSEPATAPTITPAPAPTDVIDLKTVLDESIQKQAESQSPVVNLPQNTQAQADAAQAAANDAQVKASIDPTPENIQAAQEAQLNADLAQKQLGEVTAQTPTIDETNQSILSAITNGNQMGTPDGTSVDTGVPDAGTAGVVGGLGQTSGESSQTFPVSITGEPTGVDEVAGGTAPVVPKVPAVTGAGNLPSANAPNATSPLSAQAVAARQRALLGDLGSGITFIDAPFRWLQPSVLARGGLVKLKKF